MGKRKQKQQPDRAAEHPIAEEEEEEEEEEENSDDEEIDEEEAFNSDDERKYGSFFEPKGGGGDGDESDDDDSENSDDDDDESASGDDEDSKEGDGGQYMLELLNRLDDNNNNNNNIKGGDGKKARSIAPHVKESQFSSSVIQKAGLTLDSLMEGLKDTKGFGVVQKTMKTVAQGQATSAPLAKVVSDRTQRKVHYEIQSREISQWSHAVQQNRQAETLDFRPKQRLEVTRDMMIDQFVPTTDFEKQIHAALQEAGQQDEEAMLKAEEDALHDDLGASEITLDEFKRRRGQLAKMRALMFYHEQKRHHINKIKSKKYRRIRKKQKEKQKDAEVDAQFEDDPDLARELEEREEVERMKERASLAHKNTSKWAKRVLKRGKNVDVDTRRALSAQLKRGDELLKRMHSTRGGEDDEDEDDEDEDLAETARKVLADTENDDDNDAVQGKGLFQLSFMKRGIQKQRERAKQEARQLLLELEANDDDYHHSDDDDDALKQSPKKKAKLASKEEMKQILREGEIVASSLKFGTASSVQVGDINVDLGFHGGMNETATSAGRVSEHSTTFATTAAPAATEECAATSKKAATTSSNKQKASVCAPTAVSNEAESNPWLASVADGNDASPPELVVAKTAARPASFAKRTTKRGFVDVDRAVDLLESTPAVATTEATVASESSAAAADKKITTLTQDELVQRAFATQSAQEIDDEFAREKAMVEDDEDPTRRQKKEKDMGCSQGWGSWAGLGAPPPMPPRRLPKKLQAPEAKVVKRKRVDARKPNVIISEKRVKKTADKYMMSTIPYPFTTRDEYERSMAGGVGREWNVTDSFKDMTRPEVITRAGKMIQPLSNKAKQKRAPAKF